MQIARVEETEEEMSKRQMLNTSVRDHAHLKRRRRQQESGSSIATIDTNMFERGVALGRRQKTNQWDRRQRA